MRTLKVITIHAAVVVTSVAISATCNAQDAKVPCQKIADCAQELVEIANKLTEANKELSKRVSNLEESDKKLHEDVTAITGKLDAVASKKFEFVVRRAFEFTNTKAIRIGCEEANGETLVAGSCIGSLDSSGAGGGQVGVGPFLFGSGSWDIGNPLHVVECRSAGQSMTALAVCMRIAK